MMKERKKERKKERSQPKGWLRVVIMDEKNSSSETRELLECVPSQTLTTTLFTLEVLKCIMDASRVIYDSIMLSGISTARTLQPLSFFSTGGFSVVLFHLIFPA